MSASRGQKPTRPGEPLVAAETPTTSETTGHGDSPAAVRLTVADAEPSSIGPRLDISRDQLDRIATQLQAAQQRIRAAHERARHKKAKRVAGELAARPAATPLTTVDGAIARARARDRELAAIMPRRLWTPAMKLAMKARTEGRTT